MKKHLAQLALLIPLLFVAGGVMAAYSFAGPTAAPTANNTDGPLDVSAANQIKNGDLAVNTFQAAAGSDFVQQASFAGLVNGGTAADTVSTVQFGNASNQVSVNNTGNTTVLGNYQSDSLKTGGGTEPLCANQNGTFYICSATPPAAGSSTANNTVYLSATYPITVNGGSAVGASLSATITTALTATISISKTAATSSCSEATTTPTVLGTVTIPAGTLVSQNTVAIPADCSSTAVLFTISSYAPVTDKDGTGITNNSSFE